MLTTGAGQYATANATIPAGGTKLTIAYRTRNKSASFTDAAPFSVTTGSETKMVTNGGSFRNPGFVVAATGSTGTINVNAASGVSNPATTQNNIVFVIDTAAAGSTLIANRAWYHENGSDIAIGGSPSDWGGGAITGLAATAHTFRVGADGAGANLCAGDYKDFTVIPGVAWDSSQRAAFAAGTNPLSITSAAAITAAGGIYKEWLNTLNGSNDIGPAWTLTGSPAITATGDLTGSAPPAGDTTAPTVPVGLVASTVTTSSVSWTLGTSTDAVGVTGYEVRENAGAPIDKVLATTHSKTGLGSGVTVALEQRAYDAAGNRSAWTAAVNNTSTSAALFGRGTFTPLSGGTLPGSATVYQMWCLPIWPGASGAGATATATKVAVTVNPDGTFTFSAPGGYANAAPFLLVGGEWDGTSTITGDIGAHYGAIAP